MLRRFLRAQHCSFCGKSEREVRVLVTGPDNVAICNECITGAQQIVAHAMSRDQRRPLALVPSR